MRNWHVAVLGAALSLAASTAGSVIYDPAQNTAPNAAATAANPYLGLNRVSDAKQAYLDLFATSRSLADKLLGAMKRWIDTQKGGSGADSAADLAKWVEERSKIASQTASLTREVAATGWR